MIVLDKLYQEMSTQANAIEPWMFAIAIAVVAYLTYRSIWLGTLSVSVAGTIWVFNTLLTKFDLNKEQEAVGFLIVFLLVALVVNGLLLYKAVNG